MLILSKWYVNIRVVIIGIVVVASHECIIITHIRWKVAGDLDVREDGVVVVPVTIKVVDFISNC